MHGPQNAISRKKTMLIFELSRRGRRALAQAPQPAADTSGIPASLLRETPPLLPEVSEMQVVRHYTHHEI
jgi:glycine dehydrogenase subunit 2